MRYMLIAIIFFVGLTIGISDNKPKTSEITDDLQNQLNDFEQQIQDPVNSGNYDPIDIETGKTRFENESDILSPNLFNGIAKTGDNIINGVFDFITDMKFPLWG